jgi:hypothetical protein
MDFDERPTCYLDVASAEAMAFVVSGGVSGLAADALSPGEDATVRSS